MEARDISLAYHLTYKVDIRKKAFMNKKIVSAVVIFATIIAILFCIFLPNQRSFSIKKEDLDFLSSLSWNDKETLISLGFIEYSLNNFTLDYGSGCVMRVTLADEENAAPFDLNLFESATQGKFALWFSKKPMVQRNGYGVYRNAEIYINESEKAFKSEKPKFISYLTNQQAAKNH